MVQNGPKVSLWGFACEELKCFGTNAGENHGEKGGALSGKETKETIPSDAATNIRLQSTTNLNQQPISTNNQL